MIKGLGRTPFGPRPSAPGPVPATTDAPASNLPAPPPMPSPAPPPPPTVSRARELAKEPDPAEVQYETLKRHIHMRLVDRLDMNRVSEMDPNTLRSEIRGVVEHLCDTENPLLNRNERQRLVSEILDETFGFGPLELRLRDEKTPDIMINGPGKICVEREGKIQPSEVVSRDNEPLPQTTARIAPPAAPRAAEPPPRTSPPLPNGSRFNAIIPPLAL